MFKEGFDCIRSDVKELRALVRDYIVWELNDSGGDTDKLIADLRTVDDVFANEKMGVKPPQSWAGVAPFVFRQQVLASELIVTVNHFASGGLALPQGVVIIQGFRKEAGQYVFADETGEAMFGIMNYNPIRTLPSPQPSEMWLLVCGQVAGFMGHLDRARIYGFDGYHFQELWKPEDREKMDITVKGNEIRTTFLGPKVHRFREDSQHNVEEKLQIVPSGVVQTSLVDYGEYLEPKKR